MIRRFLPWAIGASGVAVLLIAAAYPLSSDILPLFQYPMADDVLLCFAMAGLVLAGVFQTLFGRSPAWVERFAFASVLIGIGYAAYNLVYIEIGFSELFPNDGVALGWKPGEARAEFLAPWYWNAGFHLLTGAVTGTVLLVLARLKRRQQRL